MPFGYLDTKYIDFPANVDVAYIQGLRTRAGVDFAQVLRLIDQRAAAFNSTVDPLVAALITPTTEETSDGSGPTAFEVTERGEYTLARPQTASGAAIMLPLKGFDVSLGFTEDGLEQMSLSRILLNIDSLFLGLKNRVRKQALRRLLNDESARVTANATSPGFAGSGTGDNAFTRPYPDGSALPGGYTHYYTVDTDTSGLLKTTLLSAVTRLRKWHSGPFDLVANQTMIDLVSAITGTGPADAFVSAGSELVRNGSGTAEALVDPTVYIGVLFGDVRVRMAITDTTAPIISIFKSYGQLDPRNPLAYRYDPLKGRDAVIRYRDFYPLSNAVAKHDYGIGVNDRTAAVNIYAASDVSGGYTAPTDL